MNSYGNLSILSRLLLTPGKEGRARDCSEDTGLLSSCTRLLYGLKGLVTPFALGFSPPIERTARLALLVGAHTGEALLPLARTPLAPCHRL